MAGMKMNPYDPVDVVPKQTSSSSDLESKRAILSDMLPSLTCFSCKSIPNAENSREHRYNYRCVDHGHLICSSCAKQSRPVLALDSFGAKCPGPRVPCAANLSKTPCSMASKMIEILPFYCKYRQFGCEESLFQFEMVKHQTECLFYPVSCIQPGCQKEIAYMKLIEHMQSDHTLCLVGKTHKILNPISTNIFSTSSIASSLITENPLNEPRFYLMRTCSTFYFIEWVYFIGTIEEAQRFDYELKVTTSENETMTFRGKCQSIFVPKEEIYKNQRHFVFGTRLTDSTEGAFETINVIDTKAEVKDEDEESGISDD